VCPEAIKSVTHNYIHTATTLRKEHEDVSKYEGVAYVNIKCKCKLVCGCSKQPDVLNYT